MFVYLFLTIVIVMMALFASKGNSRVRHQCVGFCFIVIAIIMGFRSLSVGVDTINYYDEFNYISVTPWSTILSSFYFGSIEVGYAVFMKLCSSIINSYFFFQIVYASIFSYIWYRVFRDKEHWLFCIILFLGISIFLYSINIARQMLAVSITVYAWVYILNHKWRKALFLVVCAIFVHVTSILFALPMLLYALPNNKWIYNVMPLVAFSMIFIFPFILDFASVHMVKYVNYYDNHRESQEANLSKILWLIETVTSLLIIYNRKYFNKEDKIAAVCCLFYISFNIIGLQFNYFERLGLYYAPFLITIFLAIKKLLDHFRAGRFYINMAGICFLIYFFVSAMSAQYKYNFFFY